MGNFDSYFRLPSTGKCATSPVMDICYIYTHGSSDISHRGGRFLWDCSHISRVQPPWLH